MIPPPPYLNSSPPILLTSSLWLFLLLPLSLSLSFPSPAYSLFFALDVCTTSCASICLWVDYRDGCRRHVVDRCFAWLYVPGWVYLHVLHWNVPLGWACWSVGLGSFFLSYRTHAVERPIRCMEDAWIRYHVVFHLMVLFCKASVMWRAAEG